MPRDGMRRPLVVQDSFLRQIDPRTKIALAVATSAAAGLPLPSLALVAACFVGLLVVADVARPAAAQLWRGRLWFAVLFLLDWVFVSLAFAALITLRLALLTSSCILIFATTTPDELRLAGERLGLPPRLAFAFATAFGSLGLMEREWRGILEAQQARGIESAPARTHWWELRGADLTRVAALVMPAIVLATQHAWAISEAAAARGFESPERRAYRVLRLRPVDHALLAATALVLGTSFLLR
ncbi:MAG TPA: energy-coupling factor transporter transmembrane component T [Candidatus Margulisiibacteriota bacterium]|nr:energy-coupling factor transporter transmembrane component T [Candidatus Margulisiibacteriota bacterium]